VPIEMTKTNLLFYSPFTPSLKIEDETY